MRHGLHALSKNEFHTFVCKGSRKHGSRRCRQHGKTATNCSDQTILHPALHHSTPHHTALVTEHPRTTRRTTFPHHTLRSAAQHTEPSHPTHYRDSHRLPSMPRPRLATAHPRAPGLAAPTAPPAAHPRTPSRRPVPSRLTAACWKAPLV